MQHLDVLLALRASPHYQAVVFAQPGKICYEVGLRSIFGPVVMCTFGSGATQPTFLEIYCISVELMAHLKCFESVLDVSSGCIAVNYVFRSTQLTVFVLEHATTIDILSVVINALQRFATIWACMDVMGNITSALYNAHQVWKARGIQCRPLLALLLDFDNNTHLDSLSRERITTDVAAFSLVSMSYRLLNDHTDGCLRHFNLLQNIQRSFRKYFLRFYCSQVTQMMMHHPYWQTAFGSNIGCPLTGHGKSGITQ